LPIDRLILPRIQANARGRIVIIAPPGGGKTTALRYLRAVLPADADVGLYDNDLPLEAIDPTASRLVILTTADSKYPYKPVAAIELSPWTLDDCMEYLAAVHREQCASVLSRLRNDGSLAIAQGSAQLLTLIMNAMAGDPKLVGSREILRRHVNELFPPSESRDSTLWNQKTELLTPEQQRWWRHDGVERILVAEWITDRLCEGTVPKLFENRANSDRVPEIAASASLRPAALDCLTRHLSSEPRAFTVPMAASVLFAADPNWRPQKGRRLILSHSNFAGARWAGVDLRETLLMFANFAGADLSGADLSQATAAIGNFTGANLHHAKLRAASLNNANLWAADLRHAILRFAELEHANLTAARCESADFSYSHFSDVTLNDADFSRANFNFAFLDQVDLTSANWCGASFALARLRGCNLEGLELPAAHFNLADLTGSLFTGSRINGGDFREANLSQTGLAEIDWENCDLRDADFTHASFHLGSSRSGLVGSDIPSEGSRTGFYTDDYLEQHFKPPEEIRKASLRGANLLGAKVEGTDFYLVDLRGATYSADQAQHFARCGAILQPGIA
jgi:uncharacterized protein YjbI with pentapeptide repeats